MAGEREKLAKALEDIAAGFKEIHNQVHTPEDAVWHCANVLERVAQEIRSEADHA